MGNYCRCWYSKEFFILLLLAVLLLLGECHGFIVPTSPITKHHLDTSQPFDSFNTNSLRQTASLDHIVRRSKNTALKNGIIIDVDDNFFTVAFFSIGLFYRYEITHYLLFYGHYFSGQCSFFTSFVYLAWEKPTTAISSRK